MNRSYVRLGFCVAVAVIAAATADPLVERASNLGWFGPGNFTDRSNWDVVPTLCVGMVFAALYVCSRLRELLLGLSLTPAGTASLLPMIFAIQILTLFVMETTEQYVVYHHFLGGTIWLGGPATISLALHAVACVATTSCAAFTLRAISQAAVRLLRFVRELVTQLADRRETPALRDASPEPHHYSAIVSRVHGGRAPPLTSVA
ncbi:MAG: hypothetical protein JO101_01735 [Candidatus Eremiobacteraeota bacterium]|nr:hypothetical protein [Candidatus Eremiobacteraeota bacterium]MBV8354014.1 hypothetical protein [Candidatus Eremiobacteraeota bacterium]